MTVSHLFLQVLEAKDTSLELLGNTRSIVFLAVDACSKDILAVTERHGKSPCFSRCSVLTAVGVDERVVVLVVVDGVFFLD